MFQLGKPHLKVLPNIDSQISDAVFSFSIGYTSMDACTYTHAHTGFKYMEDKELIIQPTQAEEKNV